jgi:uncharacterized protein with HEPN domain
MSSQRLEDYLDHILTAIDRIFDYLDDIDEIEFLSNTLIQDAVIRNLEIVGEASNKVKVAYPSIQEQYPQVPFSFAYQMRNVIAHGYFKMTFRNFMSKLKMY